MMMETSSLQEALERVQSESSSTQSQGLDSLNDWLSDNRNIARADSEPDIFPSIVRVLMQMMHRQIECLMPGGGRRKVTFRIEGAACLLRTVRLSCRSSRRPGAARLARVVGKLWNHSIYVLRSDVIAQRQPMVLPYYCRLTRELAECSILGYLSEVKGAALRALLEALLKGGSADALAAGLETAAVLLRNVNADPSTEISWLCDRLVHLLPNGGVPTTTCLAALALRCPFAFRDWLLLEGRADLLADASVTAWGAKASEGLDVALRIALGLGAPIAAIKAAALLPLAVDMLDSVARSDPGDGILYFSEATKSPRAVRLAELLAALLLQAEATPVAAVRRLGAQLEQRCLPWALCAVRLCEGHPAALTGAETSALADLCDALLLQLSSKQRLTSQELAAVYTALAASVTARVWQLQSAAGIEPPPLPVPLSYLSSEGIAAGLSAPDSVTELPVAVAGTDVEWEPRLQLLASQVGGALELGQPLRALHQLFAMLLLAAPPAAVEAPLRKFLALQTSSRPAGAPAQTDRSSRCCLLAALRFHRLDPAAQKAIFKSMSGEAVDLRVTFLHLCSAEIVEKQPPLPRCLREPVQVVDDDLLCVPGSLLAEGKARGSEGMLRGQKRLGWLLLCRLEARRASATLDRLVDEVGPPVCGGACGVVAEDLRAYSAGQLVSFRTPLEVALLLKEGLDEVRSGFRAQLLETSGSTAAFDSAFEVFLEHAELFLAAGMEDVTKVAGLAAQLLPSMSVALRLPRHSKEYSDAFQQCLLRILELMVHLAKSAAGFARLVVPVAEGLGEILAIAAARGLVKNGTSESDLLGTPEIAARCLSLAEALCEAWAPSASAGASEALFSGQSRSTSNGRPEVLAVPRSSGLKLLVALACASGAGSKGGKDGHLLIAQRLQQLLTHTARVEAGTAVPAFTLAAIELASWPGPCPSAVLLAAADTLGSMPETVSSHELDDMLFSAVRLLLASNRDKETFTAVCRRFWVGGGVNGEARLLALARRWLSEPGSLSPRGKLAFAALASRSLGFLGKVGGFDQAVDLLSDCCANIVPDLILKDESCEVRFNAGVLCTRALFELFEDSMVWPDFASLLQQLAAGGAGTEGGGAGTAGGGSRVVPSRALAAVRVMLEVCRVEGYLLRVVPKLCALPRLLRPAVQMGLRRLDEVFFGHSMEGGASAIALSMRAQSFAVLARGGQRLADLSLGELALMLKPSGSREGIGRHLAAAVAALALTEELGQVPELAKFCGFTHAPQKFEAEICVALAGTVIPLRRSLDLLQKRYGNAQTLALCRSKAAEIVAFSLQLPFLTVDASHTIDGQAISVAFQEVLKDVDPKEAPWSPFPAFVQRHFRFLTSQLDLILQNWCRWAPACSLELLRAFASWVGPLPGSRLRILLPLLCRHGMLLPAKYKREACTLIETVVAHSSEALGRLAAHRDESFRELLASVEQTWSVEHSRSTAGTPTLSPVAAHSPSLVALVAVLRGLHRSCGDKSSRAAGAENLTEGGAEWLHLQIEAMLPRLEVAAQQVLADLVSGFMDSVHVDQGPLSKRARRQEGSEPCCLSPLQRLGPSRARLAWGPPPAPDLGAVCRCLSTSSGGSPEEAQAGAALSQALRLITQPPLIQQMRSNRSLARSVAQGLVALDPTGTALLATEAQGDALQEAVCHASRGRSQLTAADDLLCCFALLGASQLQVHVSTRVRQGALAALEQLVRQRLVFQEARQLLSKILDPKHLCLQDFLDLEALLSDHPTKAPSRSSEALILDSGVENEKGKTPWAFLKDDLGMRGYHFSVWVRVVCSQVLALGDKVWDGPALCIMAACAPLVRCVDWFAEHFLALALLRAADKASSGQQLAEALSGWFQEAAKGQPEAARVQCLLHALHLVRLYQTGKRRRMVPHFPLDRADPFWVAIDLCAVAECASSVGRARDGLLYLELHLAREQPNVPLGVALFLQEGACAGVDGLFREPTREVQLLHRLAQQLPDDELLYGVSQWCHTTSRLARAELGQDHLAALHLHSELRGASLQDQRAAGGERSDSCLDDALARLGLHPVLAAAPAPADGASNAVWERRMESLWRLRQWGNVPGTQGFHAGLHVSLSSLADATGRQRQLGTGSVAAVEQPVLPLVPEVTATLHARSPEQMRQGTVQLEMLGSIFVAVDAAVEDVRRGDGAPKLVNALARQWSESAASALSAQHFLLREPLHALRGALLGLVAPPGTELRFLTALAGTAREAAQVHRALGLLEQAHRVGVAGEAPRPHVLQLHWERAQCFWALRQQQEALSIARAIAAECRHPSSSSVSSAERPDGAWVARVLSSTGLWLSVSRLESPDVIRRDYLEPAVTVDPLGTQPRRQLADFLDERLSEELVRQSSLEHAISLELHRSTQAQLAAALKEAESVERAPRGRERELQLLKEQVKILQRQCDEDRRNASRGKERLKSLAMNCVQGLSRCLVEGATGNLTKVACRFLSLWFDYARDYPEITTIVSKAIPQLALGPVNPFIYQLASRLASQDTLFQQTLDELLVRIASKSAHAFWPLLLLRNGNEVPKGMRGAERFRADPAKIEAAKRVLERLRRHSVETKKVLEASEVMSKFYLAVAFHAVDKTKRDAEVQLSSVPGYRDVRKAMQDLPVPTAEAPSGDCAPLQIAGFATESFSIAKQGISAPRILRLRDMAGGEHRQLVKGMDDLRQDAVMQQLFRLLNDVFAESPQSRQANLRLRTFQVVPLSPCAGIAEWVTETVTLGELLTGNQNPAEGAHVRYRPEDWQHTQCRRHMADARQAAEQGEPGALVQALVGALKECYSRFKPVMHLAFLERFPSPTDWHAARQRYARSVAVTSMVGYIVGIGDRHPNNILFDQSTGELVHIDFGITFEAGRALRIPELVPFRLTRDMVDGLGCLGTCGLFRRCCETTMEVLRASKPLVVAVTEVFVHDPIFNWSLSARKVQARRQDAPPEHAGAPGEAAGVAWVVAGGQGTADGNEMARRALQTVKSKLVGEHESPSPLGVPAHVGWVIHEATDMGNLGRIYAGWSPWL